MLTVLGYLVLVGMAACWVLCYRRPGFALGLVMVLYTAKQLQMSYMGVFLEHSAWFNYLVFFGVCLAVVASMSRHRTMWFGAWNRVLALTLFMYLFALFAMLYSPSREYAMDRAKDGAPYWLMEAVLLPLVFVELRDVQKFCMPFLVVASAVVLLFLTNPHTTFYAGRLTLQMGFFRGVADYRGNPLATAQLGGYLAIVAALMLPMRATWVANMMRLGAVFLGLGIAISAGSRGQLILAVLVIVLFWPLARSVRNPKQFFVNSFGFGMFAVVAFFALRFFITQNVEQDARWNPQRQLETIGHRAWEAWRLIDAWLEQPLKWPFGLGTNAYSFISGEPHSYAHNVFIELLGELGLLGFACGVVLVVWIIRDGRLFWHTHRHDPPARATATVLLALAAYNLLLAMKQGTFVGPPDAWYVALIISKLVARDQALVAHGWVDETRVPLVDDSAAIAEAYTRHEAAG
ncbi:MAG: hypothetical protein HBSAPP03_09600 [Phycisphaerae bacterium]|nr:MAG: hypothetical protein HBSAPP03_09600 [Phycisphaerae bacterium]